MIPVAKSQMYQTAIAAIHTVQFQAGTYVNVRWQYRDGYGTDWYIVDRTQYGPCVPMLFADNQLTAFVL